MSASDGRAASRVAFALAAALLLACLGNVAHAPADARDACALAKAECYRAPVALDLPALPASARVLGARVLSTVFPPQPTFGGGLRSRFADALAPAPLRSPSPSLSS